MNSLFMSYDVLNLVATTINLMGLLSLKNTFDLNKQSRCYGINNYGISI